MPVAALRSAAMKGDRTANRRDRPLIVLRIVADSDSKVNLLAMRPNFADPRVSRRFSAFFFSAPTEEVLETLEILLGFVASTYERRPAYKLRWHRNACAGALV